jgi:hypothetical protein
MKRLLKAAVALFCAFGFTLAHAQLTTITASSIQMGGVPIAAGTVTLTPVNLSGIPIAFATGGGGLNAPTAFSCTITAGAITGSCQIPDAALTSPANILYSVQITNTATQKSFTMQQVANITGTTWALDHYGPPSPTTNVQAVQVAYGTAAPPASCVTPSFYVRNYSGGQLFVCVGGTFVQITGGGSSYTFTNGLVNNSGTVSPTFGTTANTFAQGNDSRFAANATAAAVSAAVSGPSGLEVFGDSISCGTGVPSYLNGYAYLLRSQVGGNYFNFCRSGDQEADQNWQRIFSSTNPVGGGLDPVFVTATGTNDVTIYSSNVNQQHIFQRAKLGSSSWLGIPATLKVLGQAATAAGTWIVDNTVQLGVAEQSTTNASTLIFNITTTAANQAAYVWYMILDANGGTFTVTLDGVAQADPYNTTTTFYAAGDAGTLIHTQNGVNAAIAGVRIPVAAAGAHTVVVTVTSATSSSNIVSVYGVGVSPASASTLNPYVVEVTPNHQNNANDALSGTYSAFVSSLVTQLAADHMNAILADTRTALGTNYATYYNDAIHPNVAGHALMDTTVLASIPSARVTGNSVSTVNSNVQSFSNADAISPSQYWSPNPNNRLDHGWGNGIKWFDASGQTSFTARLGTTGITTGFPNTGATVAYCIYGYTNYTNGFPDSNMPPGPLPAASDCYFTIRGNGQIEIGPNPNAQLSSTSAFVLNTQKNQTVLPVTHNASANLMSATFANTYLTGQSGIGYVGAGTGARTFNTGVGNGSETACGVANKWFLADYTGGTCVADETVDSTGAHTFLKGAIVGPTTAPTCSAAVAGEIQYTQGNSTTKDIVQVCAHDATNTYAWRAIY